MSDVTVDRKAKRVEVVSAEDVDPTTLEAAIERAGGERHQYEAEVIP